MEIKYKKNILEQVRELIYQAKCEGKDIDYILLTKDEAVALQDFLDDKFKQTSNPNAETTTRYFGARSELTSYEIKLRKVHNGQLFGELVKVEGLD